MIQSISFKNQEYERTNSWNVAPFLFIRCSRMLTGRRNTYVTIRKNKWKLLLEIFKVTCNALINFNENNQPELTRPTVRSWFRLVNVVAVTATTRKFPPASNQWPHALTLFHAFSEVWQMSSIFCWSDQSINRSVYSNITFGVPHPRWFQTSLFQLLWEIQRSQVMFFRCLFFPVILMSSYKICRNFRDHSLAWKVFPTSTAFNVKVRRVATGGETN